MDKHNFLSYKKTNIKKILIISDSHGGSIYDFLLSFFEKKEINRIEKRFFLNQISSKDINFIRFFNENIVIDLLLLHGITAYNFHKHLYCLNDLHFTEYKTYAYLGYNDLYDMGKKFTEYTTAKRYVDNLMLFFNNPVIILPLKNNKMIELYPYLENIYNIFINNLIQYSKLKNIKYLNIYNFIENENLNDNERKLGYALIDLFDNYESIFSEADNNKFNKNIILFELREMTNLSTKEIRNSIKKYKKLYFELVQELLKD